MKLINKTNRMKVIPLPHHTYCTALGRCVCTRLPGMKKKVATSLTILAGGTTKDLPDAILSVSQVTRLIKKQQLEVEGTNTTSDKAPQPNVKRKSKKRRKGSSPASKPKPAESPKTQE